MLQIWADYHTHSQFSHGSGTVRDNALAAARRGLEVVAITDHGPRSLPWVAASLDKLMRLREEVARVNGQELGVKVLAGVECNVISLGGDLDVPEEMLAHMDVVLAGLHPLVFPRSWRDAWWLLGGNMLARCSGRLAERGAGWAAPWHRRLQAQALEANTRALVRAVNRYRIDIVTHPGYGLPIDTTELARTCAARGTAMEISGRHGEMTAAYCRKAAQAGALFAVGSDAHRPEDVGEVARALAVVQAAGLDPGRIVNARMVAGKP